MPDKSVLVIVNPDVKSGFELAGVDVVSAEKNETEKLIKEALESSRYGIIIIEEELLRSLPPKFRGEILDSVLPLVMPIDLRREESESVERFIEEMVRRAIGFQIRVKG